MMEILNLPEFNYKIKEIEGNVLIFDSLRKKYLVLTPEEWVRQHFVNYLLSDLGYGRGLIKLEGGLKVNTEQKRSDILLFDKKGEPYMLIECKASHVKLDEKVFDQVFRYNLTIKAPYMVVTNGLEHFCFKVEGQEVNFLEKIPAAT